MNTIPKRKTAIPGTPAYWAERRAAFAAIAALKAAIQYRDRSPKFVGYSENIGPWDRVCALQSQCEANPAAVEILSANNNLNLLTC